MICGAQNAHEWICIVRKVPPIIVFELNVKSDFQFRQNLKTHWNRKVSPWFKQDHKRQENISKWRAPFSISAGSPFEKTSQIWSLKEATCGPLSEAVQTWTNDLDDSRMEMGLGTTVFNALEDKGEEALGQNTSANCVCHLLIHHVAHCCYSGLASVKVQWANMEGFSVQWAPNWWPTFHTPQNGLLLDFCNFFLQVFIDIYLLSVFASPILQVQVAKESPFDTSSSNPHSLTSTPFCFVMSADKYPMDSGLRVTEPLCFCPQDMLQLREVKVSLWLDSFQSYCSWKGLRCWTLLQCSVKEDLKEQ